MSKYQNIKILKYRKQFLKIYTISSVNNACCYCRTITMYFEFKSGVVHRHV